MARRETLAGDFGLRAQLALIVTLVAAACVGGQVAERGDETARLAWRAHQGGQHDWWDERGLVVPHASFPADCRLCHVEGKWSELRADFTFDHRAETGVPLEGAHAAAQCLRCHNDRGPARAFALRGCAGCHADVHQGQRGTDCKQCHGQDDWRVNEGVLAHSRTRFALVGPHAAAACRDCHVGIDAGVLEPLDTSCASCHTQDLARALDPDHRALGWTRNCDDCHQVSTFGAAGFVHPGFALAAGHAALACSACHAGGQFEGTPTNCAACHLDDYQSAADPNHVALGFPMTCQDCHGTSSWAGAAFEHTSWGLTGAHAATSCNACHGGGVFAGTPTDCVGCHQTQYNQTTEPPHAAAGFPTTCQDCHSTKSWQGAELDHSSFALTGAHATASCSACHGSGVYAGTATECVACHLAEFNGATDPNHVAQGFPMTCQDCHGTTTWSGATFNHTWFPITSGDHRNFACSECHLVPNNTSAFSCTHCHEHRESHMADKHQGVSGYVWQSSACYQCHPDGQEHARGVSPSNVKRRRVPDVRPAPGPTPLRGPRR